MINPERLKILLLDQCNTNNQIEHFRNAFDSVSLADDQKKLIWPKLAIWLLSDSVHGFRVIADELLSLQIENVVLAYETYLSTGVANEQILRTCANHLRCIHYPNKRRDNHIKEGIKGAVYVALNFNLKRSALAYAESVLYSAIEAEAHIKNPKRRVNGNILCQQYLDLLKEFAEKKEVL